MTYLKLGLRRFFCHHFEMKDLNVKLGELVYLNTNLVRFYLICEPGPHLLVQNKTYNAC